VGKVDYVSGQTGTGSSNPNPGTSESTTCALLDVACHLAHLGDDFNSFLDSLDDIPNQILQVLQRLFIPTSYTTTLLANLKDTAMTRPPLSIIADMVVLGANLVTSFTTTNSCASPPVDMGTYGSYTLPSRCGGALNGNTSLLVMYNLVRAGIYGALIWA